MCFIMLDLAEEKLMNQNTILIMIVVGLAVVVFLVILYCFQQRQRRANRELGIVYNTFLILKNTKYPATKNLEYLAIVTLNWKKKETHCMTISQTLQLVSPLNLSFIIMFEKWNKSHITWNWLLGNCSGTKLLTHNRILVKSFKIFI